MTQESLIKMKRLLKFLNYFAVQELASTAVELGVEALEAEEPKEDEVKEWIQQIAVALTASNRAGLVILELTKSRPQLITKLPPSLITARSEALAKTSKGMSMLSPSCFKHCSCSRQVRRDRWRVAPSF